MIDVFGATISYVFGVVCRVIGSKCIQLLELGPDERCDLRPVLSLQDLDFVVRD